MKLRWTEQAVDDLARMYDFLAAYDRQVALRVVGSLREALRQLPPHPRLGSRLAGYEPRDVRRLIVGNYEIRYEVSGEAIHVLRFFHTREDR